MRRILFAGALLTLAFLPPSTGFAQDAGRTIVTTEDTDYFGFDLLTLQDVPLEQCKAECLDNSQCRAFTYNTSARYCFLKSDFAETNPYPGAIAGRVSTSESEPDIGAPAKLTFVSQDLRDIARTYRENLEANSKLKTRLGFSRLLVQARQNRDTKKIDGAVENLRAALKISPDDAALWLELSQVAASYTGGKWDKKRKFHQLAVSAALNGYAASRTANQRAASLALLAKGLGQMDQHRAALTAYKKSLELNEVASVRKAFAEYRDNWGFRALNHTVEFDTRSPRICIQFSEDLAKAADAYDGFVTLDGTPAQAIEAANKQICVAGLEHGRRYRVGLRQGLPSSIDESLQTSANLDIYVRDRTPSARFTGNNFVLPATARRGLPLVTVNTDQAELKLFRVGERALAELLKSGQFLTQMSAYSLARVESNLGEPVWTGSVTIESELNREVVTSIPIDEALPQRLPGVYVLGAEPVGTETRGYDPSATQWFVITDIGVTTFSGHEDLLVSARSLTTAMPLDSVELILIARNNQVLGTGTTGADGQARFDGGLTRGKGGMAPYLITAKRGADEFVFLDFSNPGFDFSDRGVTGREVPKGVDVYAWTERGIYRAGETVHMAALARDPSANAVEDLPLTFIFYRPDGVEDRRIVGQGKAQGGYTIDLPLAPNAGRGTWKVQVHTDPELAFVAEHTFLVEDFLPERTDFDVLPAETTIAVGRATQVSVDGRYLYGAPAAGLGLEGEVIIRPVRTRTGYAGYEFGLATEDDGSAQRQPLNNLAPLDDQGQANFDVFLENTRATTRPQSAQLVVRMKEDSGRSVERWTSLDVVPPGTMIGVRPGFKDGRSGWNSDAKFDLIAVDPAGNRAALADARWTLVKVDRNYQWYQGRQGWRYETIDYETRIADGEIDLAAGETGKLALPVEWGRYRLVVETGEPDGPATSIEFTAGWYVPAGSTDTPDGLEIALDKDSYKDGEVAQLKVTPLFAGEMLIAIGTDRIVETLAVSIPAEGTTVDIPVGADWGAGAYVLATLYRPGEAAASRLPSRAIGVKWLRVDPQDRNLAIRLDAPAQVRPSEPLTIPLTLTNLAAGQEAWVIVAAVDNGILNLTDYETPDPVGRYFGQRKLGVAMRDLYGRLIDGSLGAAGRLRTGGDGPGVSSGPGNTPSDVLVSLYSGPVRVNAQGQAEVTFDLPQFNGSVRVMATAWSANGVGATEAETIIRDPIVIAASLPKFMAPGDQARLLVELANTDAPAGTYEVAFESSGNLDIDEGSSTNVIGLIEGEKVNLSVPVTAVSTGAGSATIRLTGPDGLELEHAIAIPVRQGALPVARTYEVSLAPQGGALVIDENLLAGNNLDGAQIDISVALPTTFNVSALLHELDRYPYGCAEQTTSRALPLLYANDFPGQAPIMNPVDLKKRIDDAIRRVLAYQSRSGGYSLWGSRSDDLWLSAYVADFLTRAREKGYEVPTEPMRRTLEGLRNTMAFSTNLTEYGDAVAYALYVLARNKQASAGDLRYYADTQLDAFRSPLARAQLAAAMALYGDHQRSERTFSSAFQLAANTKRTVQAYYSYGSRLRDTSAMLALATESRPVPAGLDAMVQLARSLRGEKTYTSTQEKVWMLLAARAEKDANDAIAINVNGQMHEGVYARRVEGQSLMDAPVRVTNRHDQELLATITAIAVPSEPPAAGGDGFTIERTYYRLDGTPANVTQVRQNERFVAVIKVKLLRNIHSRLVITDLLPAGFEIDNPRLIDSAQLKNFDWLPETKPSHAEFLNDRFVTAFDRDPRGETEFTVAYTVRAVTPGRYVHPAAQVEDMYRPQLNARTAAAWMEVSKAE